MMAPFTGRACLAYHVEVIAKEEDADTISWARVHQEAWGYVGLREETVSFERAGLLIPQDVVDEYIPNVTVFRTSRSRMFPQRIPEHLQAFIHSRNLPAATRDRLFASGRVLIFNERIVCPNDSIVVARRDAQTFFAHGTTPALRLSKPSTSKTWTSAALWGLLATVCLSATYNLSGCGKETPSAPTAPESSGAGGPR
ncbi:hypothetical protein LZC95_48270 [Pendulispora brunnea]|uniref:Uncharacterized protein n=1 Tax=Pendulispora brunnea TaxID=2905690 RepID=A0ABZ2K6B0_9BACT